MKSNAEMKVRIMRIAVEQRNGTGNNVCPRCGKQMRRDLIENSLSRYENVYICSECGVDEALMPNLPLKLKNWFFAKER